MSNTYYGSSPLDGLSPRERAGLIGRMARYQRLSAKQIADRLGVPRGVVDRALADYRRWFGPESPTRVRNSIHRLY